MAKTKGRIDVYDDRGGASRWRLRLGNSAKFAVSGESFAREGNALRAARRLNGLLAEPLPIYVRGELVEP